MRADVGAEVGGGLDDRAQIGLRHEVGLGDAVGLSRGVGLGGGHRVDVDDSACLSRSVSELLRLRVVDDLSGSPDLRRRDEVGGGHDLRHGERLDIGVCLEDCVRHVNRGGDCRCLEKRVVKDVRQVKRETRLTSMDVDVTV